MLQQGAPNTRSSNIELLRSVAMLMIIAHHLGGGSGIPSGVTSADSLWMLFLRLGGKVGVDIFVLISGYFLITAKSIKTSKVLKLWLQLLTYGILLFWLPRLIISIPYEASDVLYSFFPISHPNWWFAGSYFMLYLLSPFINKLLNGFNKADYLKFLTLLFICWSIIPIILVAPMESNNLLWLIFLYALAGFLRLHTDTTKFKSKTCFINAALLGCLTFLLTAALYFLQPRLSFLFCPADILYKMQSPAVLAMALLLFIGFLNTDIKYSPFINTVSSASFGVYLLHDHTNTWPILWRIVFKIPSFQGSPLLIPYTLCVIAAVFVGCTVIELLRIHTLERLYANPLARVSAYIDRQLDRLFSSERVSL